MNPFAVWGASPGFIVWRGSDKSPIDPLHAEPESDFARSDAQNPATWLSYEVALAYAQALGNGYGVGVVIAKGCGLLCVDIDGCVENGQLSPLASELVTQATAACADAYVEYSMSGRGVHVIGPYVGEPPLHSTKNTALHIECYTEKRYIALTGNLLLPRCERRGDLTDWLFALSWSHFKPNASQNETPAEWTTEYDPLCTFTGSDAERVATMRRVKSKIARFSSDKVTFEDLHTANADKLAAVWPASPGSKSGLPYDGSSADQAYFNGLAYCLGNNCSAIESYALSGASGLYREKWVNRPDYLRRTILNAVALPKRWKPLRERLAAIPASPTGEPPGPPGPPSPPAGVSSGSLPAVAETPRIVPIASEQLPDGMPDAVPIALFQCTDQRNAERLQELYGNSLITVAGDFYAWDGKRWKLDDGLAARFACDLSRMVNEECNIAKAELLAITAKAEEGLGEQIVAAEARVTSLSGWAAKCEMRSTQNAALELLRELLTVPIERIDANPWLLNVDNGTVNLRTGQLQPHNPADLLTKLAPVPFDPNAQAPAFRKFLSEIVKDDAAVVAFVQRWYGYSVTGDVSEQKLLIKHGPGGNGKSTLSDAIENVLGEYASPATLGLLTGKAGAADTAHLAEIAGLRGSRLVSASESEDGAKLKEALLKQLTGGDKLKAKRLYGQLFSFKPTHKLELLTNHKPVIKGSDFSIWRRIMLLSFPVKYGTAAEVAAGEAIAVKDVTLPARLKAEAPGILAWIVQGTQAWLAAGLSPPKSVLDASAEYRQQQDRIAEFIAECCTVAPGAKQQLQPLYAAYKAWCHASGLDYPVTRQRLVDELERKVPGFIRPGVEKRTAQGAQVGGIALNTPG